MIRGMRQTLAALLLFLLAAPIYAGEEKSRIEKEGEKLGRAVESIGKRAGKALERTGDNVWIRKEPKKKKKKRD